ncbi:MAG: methyltransferase [Halieaceae bacterium]|nr:methyltransferase [Halieaceae bacterium]
MQMFKTFRRAVFMWVALVIVALGAPVQASSPWQVALQGEHRSEAAKARDVYRHPRETLEFFGVTPSSTVLEMYPGGGWYTDVLAPVLAESGTLYAAHMGVNESNYARRALGGFLSKLGANGDLYKAVTVTAFNPPADVEVAPPESVDVALAIRNIHSWIRLATLETALTSIYDALKPGGIFGVVQHRGKLGMSEQEIKDTGYVDPEYLIGLAELIGFELEAQSEVNANPGDTKDYETGVWTLPPSYRLGDQDRSKYEAIGESDRMTLKFVKPMN